MTELAEPAPGVFDEIKEIWRQYLAEQQESNRRARELMEAEIRRGVMAEEQARETQRLVVAEQRRAAAVEELLARVGELIGQVEQLTRLITALVNQYPLPVAIQELADEVRAGIDRLDNNVQILLEVNRVVLPHVAGRRTSDQDRLAKAIDQARAQPHVISLKRQIAGHRQTLDALSEQASKYGLEVPVGITNGIEQIGARIAELEAELIECCAE